MTHSSWRGLVGALALLALARVPAGAQTAEPGRSPGPLSPARFQAPPREAGVHVWWHWLDGAISREGITKDLETMKAQGVVQATILNVGLFEGREFGVPRVRFASREWFAMFRWALEEARRVGVTLGVHNCDGWSSSGGPWITPELSMKQLVWTKTFVDGRPAGRPAPRATGGGRRLLPRRRRGGVPLPAAGERVPRRRPRLQVNDVESAARPARRRLPGQRAAAQAGRPPRLLGAGAAGLRPRGPPSATPLHVGRSRRLHDPPHAGDVQ